MMDYITCYPPAELPHLQSTCRNVPLAILLSSCPTCNPPVEMSHLQSSCPAVPLAIHLPNCPTCNPPAEVSHLQSTCRTVPLVIHLPNCPTCYPPAQFSHLQSTYITVPIACSNHCRCAQTQLQHPSRTGSVFLKHVILTKNPDSTKTQNALILAEGRLVLLPDFQYIHTYIHMNEKNLRDVEVQLAEAMLFVWKLRW